MPRGPKGEKRPADVIGNAVLIGRIATGEAVDTTGRNPNQSKAGMAGAKARAAALSREERTAIAEKAARSRWTK